MQSCIYVGHLRHRRYAPVDHRFRYGLYMMYLDLHELPALLHEGLLRRARLAPLCFRREDHLGDPQRPLADAVRDLIDERTGRRPAGAIRLLTGLRCFGYYFSPLNLYYCFDPRDETVETVVAEVSNTPWRETHHYVLWEGNRVGRAGELRYSHPKGFHVSPFMEMELRYDWRLTPPGARLAVQITNRHRDEPVFRAGLALSRRPLGRSQLRRILVRYPWMSGRIVLAIYYQAFRLWRKKCPFYPHPEHPSQIHEAQ
jgi:DUF1365 family protein